LAGALARVLAWQWFAVSPRDPITYGVTPPVLLAVAMLAVFVPARRATRVDPAIVLRCE
jgi:ABC-type lipoprotein release transport system permease subunit